MNDKLTTIARIAMRLLFAAGLGLAAYGLAGDSQFHPRTGYSTAINAPLVGAGIAMIGFSLSGLLWRK